MTRSFDDLIECFLPYVLITCLTAFILSVTATTCVWLLKLFVDGWKAIF